MKVEWVQLKSLLGMENLPSTIQGITQKAKTENWERRRVEGVKGRVYEYLVSDMPLEIQYALKHGYSTQPITGLWWETEDEKEKKNTEGHQNNTVMELQSPKHSTVITASDDMVHIPQYDLTASAGNGSYLVAESPVANFSFSHDWISKQGLHNKTLTVVPVKGDSMENTLHDGDLLLVSIIDEPQDAREGVCVLRYDDDIFVKRIQYDFQDQGYKITSDNKAYSEFYVGKSDIMNNRFKVIGKVERVLQRAKMPHL